MKEKTCLLAALLCGAAIGEDTVIEVPQGSGVFPTVGQVDCLEEAGSGRDCSATYECADESGDLWDDMANHDGRRALGVDSPVARQRDCSITVDGKASVRWFVGFSPDGRDGELVGVTARHDAEPPVVTGVVEASGGNGSLLDWLYNEYDITPESVIREECDHIRDGSEHDEERHQCAWRATYHLRPLVGIESLPCTRCFVKLAMNRSELSREINSQHSMIAPFADWFGRLTRSFTQTRTDRMTCEEERLDYVFLRQDWPGEYPAEEALECCQLWTAEYERLRLP